MSSELRRKIEARRRIYLLRHGEVSYFDAKGQPCLPRTVVLNTQGVAQAEAARIALAAIPFDRAVDSGVPRTRETAEIVLRGREVPHTSCEALCEVAPGPFVSGAATSIEERLLGALGNGLSREARFLGGEAFGAFQDRVLPAFLRLLSDPGWKHLLIVAHGGTNRVILLHVLGGGLERMGTLEQDAGCINLIDVEATGEMLVRQVNYTPYSPLKEALWPTTMERIFLDHFEAGQAGSRPGGPR